MDRYQHEIDYEEEAELDDDLPGFSLNLLDEEHAEANFRFQNNPKDPWQRENVLERRGRVRIECKIRDIVHGFYSGDGDGYCSLIVFRFRFDPDGLSRRIKVARIWVTFTAMDSQDTDPRVIKMYPDETYSIYPTKQKETTTTSGGANLGANILGGNIGGELKREKAVERDAIDRGTVRGSIDADDNNYGIPNGVSWTLMENATDHTGVPVSLQAAVLVGREGMSKFQGHVRIEVEADNITAARDWVTSVMKPPRKVDPVWFDPDKEPTNKLRVWDKSATNNLNLLHLESPELTDITLRKIWTNSEKET